MQCNTLYPIFLKSSVLDILIVGGGNVAEEKLHFLTKSSPDARVSLVAPLFRNRTRELAEYYGAELIHAEVAAWHLDGRHMVIATTDRPEVNAWVYRECRKRQVLVNVADNPPLCDFYMGGIVNKGHVKIAISTNGQSPTTAKRLRQLLEEVLPEGLSEMVTYLNDYRDTLRADFETKVKLMNRATRKLLQSDGKFQIPNSKPQGSREIQGESIKSINL
jgi:precorrin-2 dehydrogenase/sirohydrochlorin ferrochelatase